ncbi:MAG TPA: YdeI/OmpD-associated family protein [Chthoniobacterales bacterium]|jgi:uncharacterized protein YdeI (YjbR/CyaY-like superfamily)
MGTKDPRFDAYIASAAPFAQPILKHLRKIVHAGCPQVTETIKWGMPHFDYKGPMWGMAGFKAHCAFGFWRVAEQALPASRRDADGMGQFGRITSISDLPDKETLIGYVRKAVQLKDSAVADQKPPARPRAKPISIEVPQYLASRLGRNANARKTWDAFSHTHRKEYVEWLTSAKRDETREKRLETTLEQLAEGKPLNWKYARK